MTTLLYNPLLATFLISDYGGNRPEPQGGLVCLLLQILILLHKTQLAIVL